MRKGDISSELEKMRERRETTPPVSATMGTPSMKLNPKKENVKVSKAREHPVAPAAKAPAKKGLGKKQMMAMLAEMSDSDEE